MKPSPQCEIGIDYSSLCDVVDISVDPANGQRTLMCRNHQRIFYVFPERAWAHYTYPDGSVSSIQSVKNGEPCKVIHFEVPLINKMLDKELTTGESGDSA